MKFFSTLVASTLGVLIATGIMLFLFVLLVFAVAASTDEKPSIGRQSVLALDLTGTIPERGAPDALTGALTSVPSFGLYEVLRSIRIAGSDDRIKAIWIRSSDFSVPWSSLHEIRDALNTFRSSGKPIIASAGGYPTSENEYFLMSVADSIFVVPDAPFEFNGFYIAAEFYKRALEKLNVEPQIIRAGSFKSAVEPYLREDLSDENSLQLQAILDVQRKLFLEAVSKSRSIAIDELAMLLDGTSVLSTDDALAVGLVDRVAFPDEVESVIRAIVGTPEDRDLSVARIQSYSQVSPRDVGLSENDRNEVAVLYAEGTIVNGKSSPGSSVGSVTFRQQIEGIIDNERIKSVVVRINSPGGSATASDEILRDLRRLSDVKPVVASMGAVAASGGYWIAMAADTVVADPLSITGSIGVYTMFFDIGDLFSEKLGIDFDVVQTGPNADMTSGFRPLQSTERLELQRRVDTTYERFLELVAENRRMSIENVSGLAQGRVWIGAEAQERGLVDVIGGLDTSIRLAAKRATLADGDYVVRTYPRPASFFEQLSDRMDMTVRSWFPAVETSRFQDEAIARVRQIEELIRDAATIQARLPISIRME